MKAAVGIVCIALACIAQAQEPIRIGVMNDQSSVYADFQGKGSVLAAEMAVEDYGGKAAGRKVEGVFADHQNKPDVGSVIARKWLDPDGGGKDAGVPKFAGRPAGDMSWRAENKGGL